MSSPTDKRKEDVMALTISPELQSLIPPLSPEELDQLTINLLNEGCRDALIVWQEEQVLLDGHHRLQICEQHGLPYHVREISLPDLDAAKAWLISHQLGRRNLTPHQLAYFWGSVYLQQKQQGRRTDLTSAQNEQKLPDTATALAAQSGVSAATIRRYADYAKAVDVLTEKVGPTVRQVLLDREWHLTREDVERSAAWADNPEYVEAVRTDLEQSTSPYAKQNAFLHAIRLIQCGASRKFCATCGRARSHADALISQIPVCPGHPQGSEAEDAPPADETPAPPILTEMLVLEPEDPEVEETTATTLTEREQAYFGPRTDKPPGSVAWCWATIALMQTRWKQKELDEAGFNTLVDELCQHEAWKVVPREAPYGTLGVLLQEELGLDRFAAAALAPDHPLHDELVLPSSVDQALHEAMENLERLEAYCRATPQLFEVHQQGYLALKDACLRFAALLAPAEPPAPQLAPAEAPTRLRNQVGLQGAVYVMVKELQPCTNAQVRAALKEQRPVVHAALQALVKKGKVVKEGETYRDAQA
jgi:hypothetical protein